MENLKILLFLVRSNTSKFINFIMAEMFNWIDNSYLVNLVNSQKTKGKAQISLLFHLMDCKYGEKKQKGLGTRSISSCHMENFRSQILTQK